MKKISLVLLSLTMAFLLCLSGCTKEAPSVTPPTDDATTDPKTEDQGASENIPPVENSTRIPPEEENPASDFNWKENEEGKIIISKYVGEDIAVVVPAQISGKDVVEIGHAAFAITGIESIFLPDSVIAIGPFAFQHCRKLKKVDMSNFVISIKGAAFEDCPLLEEISLPKSLVFCGGGAFKNCTALKSIHLPRNLKLGGETFACSGLESVTFEEGFSGFTTNDFIFTNVKRIVLPRGCKKIDYNSLCIGESLEEIVLNDDLEEIGSLAFLGNSNLKKIVIPSSVKRMGAEPFVGCTSLEDVLFEGDAPTLTDKREELFYVDLDALNYVVYHHKEAKGFTSPEWNGHQTEIW